MMRDYEEIFNDARIRAAAQWERLREFTSTLLRREIEYTDQDEIEVIDETRQHFGLSPEEVKLAVTICELEVQKELVDV
ncbi:MAG TPA: hypothetical protein VLG25_01955 [Patescibacteria group bacterium]|nr:hypothetical protein [Patescibacteria group bacterium]